MAAWNRVSSEKHGQQGRGEEGHEIGFPLMP
jgi:hypothetical protein